MHSANEKHLDLIIILDYHIIRYFLKVLNFIIVNICLSQVIRLIAASCAMWNLKLGFRMRISILRDIGLIILIMRNISV